MADRARSLDLLLVNPGGRHPEHAGDGLAAKEPPIWAALLANHARLAGRSVQVLDANAGDWGPELVGQMVAELRPLLCVVVVDGHDPRASTAAMPGAQEVCNALAGHDPEGKVMLLGGHVAALPERTLRCEQVDYVCGGEGPYTILELIAGLRADYDRPELAKVRGLWWWNGDAVQQNPPAPLARDLAREMPGMAWDLLPMGCYRAHTWHCFGRSSREPYAALYTSLGGPVGCRDAGPAARVAPRNGHRRFDPDAVVAQITNLVDEHGVRNIAIADESFLQDERHVRRICDGLIDLRADLNIRAQARVPTCRDAGLLARMRRAGVRWLAIGIEPASQKVREVDRGDRPEAIRKAIDRVRQGGIHVMGNYVFGLPGDDFATMRETLDFAKDLNTEFADFCSAMAHPGSWLHRDAAARAFRDAACREYLDRPAYQAMVLRLFGPGAVAEVGRMVAQGLARAHTLPAPDAGSGRTGS